MSRRQTPKCHACGRVHADGGWTELAGGDRLSEVYETLCKDCLAGWTDHLLREITRKDDDQGRAA